MMKNREKEQPDTVQHNSSEVSSRSVDADNREAEKKGGEQTSGWEWALAVLGALCVLCTVAYLLYQAIYMDSTPPDIVVTVDSVRNVRQGYLLLYSADNSGGSAAANLMIYGELWADTGKVEESSGTLDYLPSRSERHGGLFFTHDPQHFELQLRPEGYAVP
jgi:uncharacterized protein (TIGR02588 family)